MCLGIPGEIVTITNAETKQGMMAVAGVRRPINLACVWPENGDPSDLIGQWALVHVGFAMSLIDPEEAAKTLALLTELGEAQEEINAMKQSEHERAPMLGRG